LSNILESRVHSHYHRKQEKWNDFAVKIKGSSSIQKLNSQYLWNIQPKTGLSLQITHELIKCYFICWVYWHNWFKYLSSSSIRILLLVWIRLGWHYFPKTQINKCFFICVFFKLISEKFTWCIVKICSKKVSGFFSFHQ
jgi:hypothetical protein